LQGIDNDRASESNPVIIEFHIRLPRPETAVIEKSGD